jgi:hypothetical protein
MNAVVLVEVRNVYGRETIYPANDNAERLAAIAGAKTLQLRHLELARGLGLEVREVTQQKLAATTDPLAGMDPVAREVFEPIFRGMGLQR